MHRAGSEGSKHSRLSEPAGEGIIELSVSAAVLAAAVCFHTKVLEPPGYLLALCTERQIRGAKHVVMVQARLQGSCQSRICGPVQHRHELLLSSVQGTEKPGPGCRARRLICWRARLHGPRGQPRGLAGAQRLALMRSGRTSHLKEAAQVGTQPQVAPCEGLYVPGYKWTEHQQGERDWAAATRRVTIVEGG